MEKHNFSFATTLNPVVDVTLGVIKDVSVITRGEAKGHGLMIDNQTILEVKKCAETYKDGLKVKLNHGSGVDAICGLLKNFRLTEDKLIADLHLIKTHSEFQFLMELAQTIPDTFGLSIAFSGKDEMTQDGKVFARCSEIYSADIVSEPAANPSGLFEAKNERTNMEEKQNAPVAPEAPVDENKARFEALEASLSEMKCKLESMFPPKEDAKEEVKEELQVPEEKPVCDEEEEKEELQSEDKAKELESIVDRAVIKALSACGVKPLSASPVEKIVEKVENKKDFKSILGEKLKEFEGDKVKAFSFMVKNHPDEYRAAMMNGELVKI